jgi:hypothetical protein
MSSFTLLRSHRHTKTPDDIIMKNGSNGYSKIVFLVSYYYIKKITFHFKIWDSHGGTYEQYCFGMWYCIALWNFTDILDECSASIFRMEE